MRRLALVVLGAAVVSGCAFIGRQVFRQPVVTLRDVRLVGFGVAGGNLDVVLNVYNPNDFRLDATHFSYRLLVDTMQIATGEIPYRNTFNARDSATVRIPVQFSYSGVSRAGQQLMQTGAVEYHVVGDVTVGTIIGDRTIPFSSTGRFSTLAGAAR